MDYNTALRNRSRILNDRKAEKEVRQDERLSILNTYNSSSAVQQNYTPSPQLNDYQDSSVFQQNYIPSPQLNDYHGSSAFEQNYIPSPQLNDYGNATAFQQNYTPSPQLNDYNDYHDTTAFRQNYVPSPQLNDYQGSSAFQQTYIPSPQLNDYQGSSVFQQNYIPSPQLNVYHGSSAFQQNCILSPQLNNYYSTTALEQNYVPSPSTLDPMMLDPKLRDMSTDKGTDQTLGTVDERGTIDAPAGTVDERGTANAPQGTVDRRGTIGAPAAEGSGSKKKAYGKGFKPTKQHLHELVKAELILAGDIIRYEDRNKYDCTIIVRGISSRHYLNVTLTFPPNPTLAATSSSRARRPAPANGDKIANPTALENAILECYGIDTTKLAKKWRKTWDSFTVARNGEELGTFADLRKTLGMQRLEWTEETKREKGFFTRSRSQKTAGAAEAGFGPTSNGNQNA